jgi:hypothetical protein
LATLVVDVEVLATTVGDGDDVGRLVYTALELALCDGVSIVPVYCRLGRLTVSSGLGVGVRRVDGAVASDVVSSVGTV